MSDEEVFDFSKKRKPKGKTLKKEEKTAATSTTETEKPSYNDPYQYDQMLERLVKTLKERNHNSNETKKLCFPPIQLESVGLKKHKKYLWKNFSEFPLLLNRPVEHLREFFAAQLSIEPIVTEEVALKLEGRKMEREELQTILVKYIHEYVKCPLCMSAKTAMIKDSSLRVYVINCDSCKAQRSLAQIRTAKK